MKVLLQKENEITSVFGDIGDIPEQGEVRRLRGNLEVLVSVLDLEVQV